MLKTRIKFSSESNPEKETQIYFRSSPSSNRNSILKNGLTANPRKGHMWDFQNPSIYAHDSLQRALDWQGQVMNQLVYSGLTFPKYFRCDIWVIN